MNNRLNRADIEQIKFFEEQLFEAKQALFFANSVRRVKFLRNKIKYIQEKISELKKI